MRICYHSQFRKNMILSNILLLKELFEKNVCEDKELAGRSA